MDNETPQDGGEKVTRVEGDVSIDLTITSETGAEEAQDEQPQATPITDAPSARKDAEGGDGPLCIECSTPLVGGKCANADCSVAQAQWSVGASRTTAKAAAAAAQDRPRAWSSSGRVD